MNWVLPTLSNAQWAMLAVKRGKLGVIQTLLARSNTLCSSSTAHSAQPCWCSYITIPRTTQHTTPHTCKCQRCLVSGKAWWNFQLLNMCKRRCNSHDRSQYKCSVSHCKWSTVMSKCKCYTLHRTWSRFCAMGGH